MAFGTTFQLYKESPGWLLWELTNSWQRLLQSRLEKYDLTNFQYLVLRSLLHASKQSQKVSQIELAEMTHANVMMISKVIRSLIKKGLITRKRSHQDYREKLLTITDVGLSIVEKAFSDVKNLNQEFFSVLDDETMFQETLSTLLSLSVILFHQNTPASL